MKPSKRLEKQAWALGLILGLGQLAQAAPGFDFGSPTMGELPLPGFSLSLDPKVNLGSSLRFAARSGRIKEVQRLLDAGADVNAPGEYGETALYYASRMNQIQVVNLLVSKGADLNARDSEDRTALIASAMDCAHRVGAVLIRGGANVNLPDHDGRSALIYATRNGCEKFVLQLLSVRGIDVNARDDAGNTALDYAMEEAQLEVGGPFTNIAIALRRAGGRTSSFQLVPRSLKPAAEVLPGGLK